MRPILSLALFIFTAVTNAAPGPQLVLCSYECSTRAEYTVMPDHWTHIKNLFKPASSDAQDERNRLAQAIALMERDIIMQIASEFIEEDFADQLKQIFTNQDETRNTSKFIALLIDQGLVSQHVLRRSEARRSMFGVSQTTAVIQSLYDGARFAVDATSSGFGEAPVVMPFKQWKNASSVKKLGRNIKDFLFSGDEETATGHSSAEE